MDFFCSIFSDRKADISVIQVRLFRIDAVRIFDLRHETVFAEYDRQSFLSAALISDLICCAFNRIKPRISINHAGNVDYLFELPLSGLYFLI